MEVIISILILPDSETSKQLEMSAAYLDLLIMEETGLVPIFAMPLEILKQI